MTEGRLDFSDYSAKEQAADEKKAHRLKIIRHAYLMKVSGEWAHFIVGQSGKDDIAFYGDMELEAVYRKIKHDKPDYMPKVIQNKGLENYLREHRAEYKTSKVRQLQIDFKRGGNDGK